MATCGVWCLVLLTLSVGCLSSAGPPPGQNWENIAIGKSCSMSSMYTSNDYPYFPNNCSTAINGNTGTTYTNGNCIFTASNDNHPNWTVNLGQKYTIHWITIYFRGNNLNRMNNVTVSLDAGTPVYTVNHYDGPLRYVFDIPLQPPRSAQEVTLARQDSTSTEQAPFLNICEVQVWVCARGFYGNNCTRPCGAGCNARCNSANGHCSCTDAWQKPLCQECAGGHYNKSGGCSQRCGHCAGGALCDKNTGYCPSCEPGWISPLCQQQCHQGRYGNNCRNNCGTGCSPANTCNIVNGTCSCASNNWETPMCATCASGHFNVTSGCRGSCEKGCDGACDVSNGTCTCKPGWKSPHCNDCTDGYYGASCYKCGHCANNTVCDKTSGHCPASCEVPFQPPLCKSPCNGRRYGLDCKETCGQCADDEECNKTTGYCTACKPGWTLPRCQEKCPPGSYGQDCNETCGHCKQKASCEHDTGHCPSAACDDGFAGQLCKAKSEESDGGQQSLVGPVVGSIVGSIFGVGLLFTISTTAAICWRRRSEENPVRTNNPPIALSDRKTCAPDPPTPASTDARVPATTAEDGVYVEIGGTENTYDKLHPYSNQDAESQQYTQLASGGRDVDTPTADSAYVNTSLPMGKEGGKI